MVNESNETIFKSLFIDLDLRPAKIIWKLDLSVILQQRRLCPFKNQCHKHVLFNVCTAFLTFLCWKNTLRYLEHPSIKVIDDFRWSSYYYYYYYYYYYIINIQASILYSRSRSRTNYICTFHTYI